ncbi:hypothetical protein N9W79_02555 [bacterium]|nr:hypothetical protein [bacterium]
MRRQTTKIKLIILGITSFHRFLWFLRTFPNRFESGSTSSRMLIMLINDIYKNYWNPLQNYFYPAMKLKSKTRIGGRLRKTYDTPKTPYERVLECDRVEGHVKENLKLTMEHLNPIKLKEGLEKKLRLLQSLLTPSQIKGERQIKESA